MVERRAPRPLTLNKIVILSEAKHPLFAAKCRSVAWLRMTNVG